MNINLLKNLSTFIVTAILFSTTANSQIAYTDVNPDASFTCSSSPCTQSYNLDLNNDGLVDFTLFAANNTTPCTEPGFINTKIVYITSQSGNGTTFTFMMNANDLIGSNLAFSASAGTLRRISSGSCLHGPPSSGSWTSTSDHYLGLKLTVGTSTYYGWVRLNVVVSTSVSFTVKDYAYNTIPNQPIRAGETSCTIPTVGLTQSGSLSFCAGDSVTLTANGTGYQYQWKKNSVNISGATAQTYVAKTAGIYNCKVTNSCGTKGSGTRTVTVPCRNTNDNVVEALEHLSVYPNPATNAVTIKFPSDEAGDIQVVNLFGQIIYSEKVDAEQKQIDVSRFAAGMYLIRWSSGENFETKTFSVTK